MTWIMSNIVGALIIFGAIAAWKFWGVDAILAVILALIGAGLLCGPYVKDKEE